MSERVAIVAGAGGELGRATAEKLAAAGFTVVGVDRSEEGLKELPGGIRREAANPTDPAAARQERSYLDVTHHIGHALGLPPTVTAADDADDAPGHDRASPPGTRPG